MNVTRRGFFGLLAVAAAAPTVVLDAAAATVRPTLVAVDPTVLAAGPQVVAARGYITPEEAQRMISDLLDEAFAEQQTFSQTFQLFQAYQA